MSDHRAELADFLRARREAVRPEQVGLPRGATRRRTPGLRREEVAMLAGVSLTWYTWLEQGRDIHPSRQVIDALARTLRLSAAEHEYALRLAGQGGAPGPRADSMPAHLQRLLDAVSPSPSYVITASWSIVGWNDAYEHFYPGVAAAPPAERNLLWLVFTDPAVRSLLGDWAADSRRFLTQFRADAGPRLTDPDVVGLVTRLQAASPEFRTGWASHDVDRFTSAERRFEHPVAGTLLLEHHQLTPVDAPGLQMVVYTAAEGSDTAAKLARLCA